MCHPVVIKPAELVWIGTPTTKREVSPRSSVTVGESRSPRHRLSSFKYTRVVSAAEDIHTIPPTQDVIQNSTIIVAIGIPALLSAPVQDVSITAETPSLIHTPLPPMYRMSIAVATERRTISLLRLSACIAAISKDIIPTAAPRFNWSMLPLPRTIGPASVAASA